MPAAAAPYKVPGRKRDTAARANVSKRMSLHSEGEQSLEEVSELHPDGGPMTLDSSAAPRPLGNLGPPSASIRRAQATDLAGIERLLVASGLPTDGVGKSLDGFLVAENADSIVGVVGVERCREYGLLRSTAVAPEWRSRGLGRQLVERAIAEAEANGLRALYLLTTTAERYFPSFGFATTTREEVPESVQNTGEFRVSCPASATVMVRSVNREP
jgi:amino-acid N-acetyltransferase